MPERIIKSLKMLKTDQFYKQYQGFEKDFPWLVEHLLPFSEKIKGCEIVFPDTVFFRGGLPVMIVKMDKDFCLTSIKNKSKLSLQNILKDFQNIARDRKKDT